MYEIISFSQFKNAFKEVRPNNFSHEGLEVLFDYLEQYEDDTDKGMELDVIAICCDFTECTTKEVLSNYNLESLEELEDNTAVLKIDDDTIIYQNY